MTIEPTFGKNEIIIDQIRRRVKPDGMSQDLFEYATRTLQLDEIFNELTRDYCKSRCTHGHLHCCFTDFHCYKATEELIKFQEQEILEMGLPLPPEYFTEGCRYRSKEGCKIMLFKTPICINHLCSELYNEIEHNYGQEGKNFKIYLQNAERHNSGLLSLEDRDKMFLYMDKAIVQGRKLVEMKKNNGWKK